MEHFSFHTSSVLTWLFESTIYISLLICLIFAIRSVVRKKLPVWWGYGLWLMLILRMLAPWGFENPLNVFNYMPAPPKNDTYMPFLMEYQIPIPFMPGTSNNQTLTASALKNDSGTVVDTHDISEPVKKKFNLSLDKAFLIIWFSGIIFFCIFTLYNNLKFWAGIRSGRKIKDYHTLALLAECRSLHAIRREVSVIVTDSVKSPAIFGYVKPRLLLPPDLLETLAEDQLRCVFLHELGHMKRHDIGISWIVTALQIIYWFNPLVWFAFHHLRTDQEIACDAYVLSKINQVQPVDYADTIVGLLERFVQNRQLPSLAGVIENSAQIDRRISMILNFKKYTMKMTLASVFMFLIIGLLFFTSASGLSPENVPGGPEISGTTDSGMKHYESDEWNFAIDIPEHWNAFPPNPANSPSEVARFGGLNPLIVFRSPYDPRKSLREVCEETQKILVDGGYENFTSFETTIGPKEAMALDFDKPMDEKILRCREYFIIGGDFIYGLAYGSDKKDGIFETFERIAQTFEIFDPIEQPGPTSSEMRLYESEAWNFALEIPGDWTTLLPVASDSPEEVVRFTSSKGGRNLLIVYRGPYDPSKSLYEFRDNIQKGLADGGFGNFIQDETTIGSKKALTHDFDKTMDDGNLLSFRRYYLTDGTLRYTLGFITTDGHGMFALFDRIAKTFETYDTPVTTGLKHYKNYDYNFELDIPGRWNSMPHNPNTSSNEVIRFESREGGSHLLVVVRNPGSPDQTLREACDRTKEILAKGGGENFVTAETTIGSKDVVTLDFNQPMPMSDQTWSVRYYYIPDGDLIYVLGFGTTDKDGMIDLYDRVAKTFRVE